VSDRWPHQVEALEFLRSHSAALLHLDMGTGKTRIAADLLRDPGTLPALVVTRSKAITDGIWERECEGADIQPLRGKLTERAELIKGHDIVLTNYEAVWQKPIAAAILRIPWRTVIADESHHIKAAGSKVSMFFRALSPARHRIALTGTPLGQTPLDVYGQFRFLDRRIFGNNFRYFRARYAIMGGYEDRVFQRMNPATEADFLRRFRSITYHAEPDLGVPDGLDIPMTHSLPPAAARIYRELEDEFWAEVEGGEVTIANGGVKVLRLQQLASGHLRTDDGVVRTIHTERADMFCDWLEDVDSAEPVVVFARFTHDLSEVRRVCAKLGRTYSEVSGRADDLVEWKGGATQVLGVQIQAGGEAINLTRAALCVYYSIGHSLLDYLQSRKRLIRPGQTQTVRIYHLSARGTVDTDIYRALRNRDQVIQSLLARRSAAQPILI